MEEGEEERERISRYSLDNMEYMSMPEMDEPLERASPPVTPPPDARPPADPHTRPPITHPSRGVGVHADC